MSKSKYVKENIIKNKEYYYGAYSRYFSDIMGSDRNTSILFGSSNDSSRQKVMPLKRFILNLYHHTN